jgi:hypothetical protein
MSDDTKLRQLYELSSTVMFGTGAEHIKLAHKLFGRKQRKPSVARLIEQAKKKGATAITIEGDKVSVTFGEPEPTEPYNPWLKAVK